MHLGRFRPFLDRFRSSFKSKPDPLGFFRLFQIVLCRFSSFLTLVSTMFEDLKKFLLFYHIPGRSSSWSGHWQLHYMPSKLGNALPLFINKEMSSFTIYFKSFKQFNSGKSQRYASHWALNLQNFCASHSKTLLQN